MRRNQHEWDYIATTPNGELGFCHLCNQFRYDMGKPFKMNKEQLDALKKYQYHIAGLMTALAQSE